MKKFIPLILVVLGCHRSGTQTPRTTGFADLPEKTILTGRPLTEVSGIADSRRNAGYLWAQEDSGNPPLLFLIAHDGAVSDSVALNGAANRDWEEIAIGPGPMAGSDYVYIADIGDNNAQYPSCTIYRLPEPARGTTQVSGWEAVEFVYDDGPRDAEALLVDNVSGDIYIITKREVNARVYTLPYPQRTAGTDTARFVGELPYSGVTGAALSPDGADLLVKTYTEIFHYTRLAGTPLGETLMHDYRKTGYQAEPQGEAVSFGADNGGFFTLSEEAFGIMPTLNYYKRK